MGLKKRNKVSAEFSMSSLTDIIFLLLIFFMLTANFVQIDPFDLPTSDSKTVAATSLVVTIDKAGIYTYQGNPVNVRNIERSVRRDIRDMEDRNSVTLTIAAQSGVPFNNVAKIMEVAGRLRIKAILATQPST
ncbi:MAG: biopolymer transporter ExbD [Bacteroidetes bacterium]|jgi:biopolymer transport protein ExbD|nr:biopolymer transporter ExbD [Bacteroidota bacterium]MDF1866862.1 biopolymer transporter ExbD [Saprospiraceae bacterium]